MSRRTTSSTRPSGFARKSGVIYRPHVDWGWAAYEGYLDNVIWLRRVTGIDHEDPWS